MVTKPLNFYSEGKRLAAFLRFPSTELTGPAPAIVQGPGWLGLARSESYARWHEAFTDRGYVVLAFDYRGFGDSEGERGWVNPLAQVEDIRSAVSFLEGEVSVDPHRIGVFGMGGTGGGNAVIAAGTDARIKCCCVQTVVADGTKWLHDMRREYEWVDFQSRLTKDRIRWARDNVGERVDPREELMIATPERRSLSPKASIDKEIGSEFYLRSADYILRYRPLDYVSNISPRALLIACVVDDVVTPEDHALALYERAGPPKRLLRQHYTSHYRSYRDNFELLSGEMVSWYDSYLRDQATEVKSTDPRGLHE